MKAVLDGRPLDVASQRTILDLARENGIYIPTLCDHPRLAPHTACRLCIVQIKGRKGVVPACGTMVEDGMKIVTTTSEIERMRRQILELILSEHPSACLICSEKATCEDHKSTIRKVGEVTGCVLCPSNGRCELQTVVERLKPGRVEFPAEYRNLDILREDPFFDRNYNLCILCGRCVRICHDVRGASAIAFLNRGPRTVIGTANGRRLLESNCQFCGACVDVCPTGALFEKAVKYESLPETKAPVVCGFCSQGCHLILELAKGRVLASIPAPEGAVNRGQACVRGRFLVSGAVHHPRRVLKPLIRKDGALADADWDQALGLVAEKLLEYAPEEIGVIGSAQDPCEDLYVFRRFVREALKTQNVAGPEVLSPQARMLEMGDEQGLRPALNYLISDISKVKSIFLFGGLPPMVGLEVHDAVRKGAKLIVVGGTESPILRCARAWIKIQPGKEGILLAGLSRILHESGAFGDSAKIQGAAEFRKRLHEVKISDAVAVSGVPEDKLRKLAQLLDKKRPAAYLFGPAFGEGFGGRANIAALWNLALQTHGLLIPLPMESNSRGALAIADAARKSGGGRPETLYREAAAGAFKALYLAGPLPKLDRSAAEFIVVQDSYLNDNTGIADVVLPQATFAESGGTFVNTEGRVQRSEAALAPLGESKPGWRIAAELARRLGRPGFEFRDVADIFAKLAADVPAFRNVNGRPLKSGAFVQEPPVLELAFALKTPSEELDGPAFEHNPDRYQGLAMDREIKGLKIFRGRT